MKNGLITSALGLCLLLAGCQNGGAPDGQPATAGSPATSASPDPARQAP